MPPLKETMLRRHRFLFIGIAALLTLIYVGVWLFYTTPAWSASRQHKEIFVWPLVILVTYLYWLGYKPVKSQAVPTKWVAIGGLLVAIAAIMIPPFHSTDIYGYINRGWQQLHYGMNPYVHPVNDIPHWNTDPMITDHWVNNPSPYGFLYLITAKILCFVGAGYKTWTVWVFKLFNLLVHALTGVLLWFGVRRLERFSHSGAWQSVQQASNLANMSLYLYAFNPLVLFHGLANGHNDMYMGLFITLSAFWAILGGLAGILPSLTAATLVKYGAAVIVPPAILFLMKNRGWRSLSIGLLVSGLVFLVCGLPYLGDWPSFHLKEIGQNAFVSHGSLHSLIFSIFKAACSAIWPWVTSMNHWSPPISEQHLLATKLAVREWLKNGLLFAYAGFYAWLGMLRVRQKGYPLTDWIQDALLVMVVMVCLVSLKFYPWYVGMFFPLALFLKEGHWLRGFVVVLSGAQMLSLTFIGQAHVLNFLLMTGVPIVWAMWQSQRTPQIASTAAPARK